jgi:hypothetical protein
MNLQHDLLEDNQDPRERFINAANVLIVFIDFLHANNPGVFILGRSPRNVEVALMRTYCTLALRYRSIVNAIPAWTRRPSAIRCSTCSKTNSNDLLSFGARFVNRAFVTYRSIGGGRLDGGRTYWGAFGSHSVPLLH